MFQLLFQVACRQETARTNKVFKNAEDAVQFLSSKFNNQSTKVEYNIRELTTEELDVVRESSSHRVYNTVSGSQKFQVIISHTSPSCFVYIQYVSMSMFFLTSAQMRRLISVSISVTIGFCVCVFGCVIVCVCVCVCKCVRVCGPILLYLCACLVWV